MWGRKSRIQELEAELFQERSWRFKADAAVSRLEERAKSYEDRVRVLQRHVTEAEVDREKAYADRHGMATQVDRLAKWFEVNAPGAIRAGSTIDNAIRLLDERGAEAAKWQGQWEDASAEVISLENKLTDAEAALGLADSELKQLRIERDELVKKLAAKTTPAMQTKKPAPKITPEVKNH